MDEEDGTVPSHPDVWRCGCVSYFFILFVVLLWMKYSRSTKTQTQQRADVDVFQVLDKYQCQFKCRLILGFIQSFNFMSERRNIKRLQAERNSLSLRKYMTLIK